MDLANELTIVSAFGRGQWLASERARKGQKVNLVDVSEALGSWSPEDWEGPFGFFKSANLTSSQLERLLEDDTPEALAHGFTLWLKDGPLEFKGPVTEHRLEALGIPGPVREYLELANFAQQSETKPLKEQLGRLPFAQAWPAYLAHQLFSSRYVSPRRALSQGQTLPLFASFLMRRATRSGYQRSLDWAEQTGVNLYSGARLIDIAYDNFSQVRALEIQSRKHSGVLKNQQMIWMLSTLETLSFGEAFYRKVFSTHALDPQWCWMRFQLALAAGPERDILPVHLIFVDSLELPWTHDNLAIMNRSYSAEMFDVWMRIPYGHRFEKNYLEKMAKGFSEKLAARLPQCSPRVQTYPPEYNSSYKQLGAPRFPVYAMPLPGITSPAKNLILDGPEHWPGLDWGSQLAVHRELSRALELKYQEALRKEVEL